MTTDISLFTEAKDAHRRPVAGVFRNLLKHMTGV